MIEICSVAYFFIIAFLYGYVDIDFAVVLFNIAVWLPSLSFEVISYLEHDFCCRGCGVKSGSSRELYSVSLFSSISLKKIHPWVIFRILFL